MRFLRTHRRAIVLILMLVSVKASLLAIDSTPRLFMADSAGYLHHAVYGGTPSDRSFIYPMLIAFSALAGSSLLWLLWLQALFGVAGAFLTGRILVREFAMDWRYGAAAALLLGVEPAQLYYERMVMAESAGTLALLGALSFAFAYLRSGDRSLLFAQALCGIAAVSLRLSLLPVILGSALLPVIIRHWSLRNWRCGARDALFAVVATTALHFGYTHWYAARTGGEPDYVADGNFMRLGLVAPLLKPQHFAGTGVSPAILDQLGASYDDPLSREAQIWNGDGLAAQLRAASPANARRIAGTLARRAVVSDPVGFVRLGIVTASGYFDAGLADARMRDDLGIRRAEADVYSWINSRFHYDATRVEPTDTTMARYFQSSGFWLTLCLFGLSPLALLQWFSAPTAQRAASSLLALVSLGLVASQVLFAHIISYRYLHPFPPLFLLNLGALLAHWQHRRTISPAGHRADRRAP